MSIRGCLAFSQILPNFLLFNTLTTDSSFESREGFEDGGLIHFVDLDFVA